MLKRFVIVLITGLMGFVAITGCQQAKTGHFEELTNCPLDPTRAQMTLLKDGKVLFLGDYPQQQGEDWNKKGNAIIIFDPVRKSFQIVGKTLEQRTGAALALLPNGKVILGGGFSGSNEVKDTTEFFDPLTKKSTLGPLMLNERANQKAFIVDGNEVWFFGGRGTAEYISDQWPKSHKKYNAFQIEKYDFQKNSFQAAFKTSIVSYKLKALILQNRSILLASGDMGNARIELYNPITKQFILKSALKYPYVGVGLVELKDKSVFIYGPIFDQTLKASLIFNPVTLKFKDAAPLEKITSPHTSVVLDDGQVLVSGQVSPYNQSEAIELYTPNTDRFRVVRIHNHSFNAERMLKLNNGTVFMTGLPGKENVRAELYIPD